MGHTVRLPVSPAAWRWYYVRAVARAKTGEEGITVGRVPGTWYSFWNRTNLFGNRCSSETETRFMPVHNRVPKPAPFLSVVITDICVPMQNPEKGFLKNGSLTVRLRLRLLFLIVHVYTTGDLASHRGFGVVPVRGQDRSFHFSGGSLREGGGQEGEYPSPGPLSCLTFEVLRCTTLEEMEIKIAQALNLTSTQDLRLWVITQPLTDGPLAPWHLLRLDRRCPTVRGVIAFASRVGQGRASWKPPSPSNITKLPNTSRLLCPSYSP